MIRKKQLTEDEARMRLADLCARSEQCESDLVRKMRLWGLSGSAISDIIDTLKREKFLDDSRFARAYARDKARFSKWGRNKIRAGLSAKRISSADIAEGLASIDVEEYNCALRSAALTKARPLDLNRSEDVRKLYAHLLSRGYESSLIQQVIREIKAGDLKDSGI